MKSLFIKNIIRELKQPTHRNIIELSATLHDTALERYEIGAVRASYGMRLACKYDEGVYICRLHNRNEVRAYMALLLGE